MAAKLKHQPQEGASNVVVLSRCTAEGCGKKSERFNFCTEHYDWFKFGLINKAGQKPIDFERKHQAYLAHKTKKAA